MINDIQLNVFNSFPGNSYNMAVKRALIVSFFLWIF